MNEKQIDTLVNLRVFFLIFKSFAESALNDLEEAFSNQKKEAVKRKGRPVGSKNKPKGKTK